MLCTLSLNTTYHFICYALYYTQYILQYEQMIKCSYDSYNAEVTCSVAVRINYDRDKVHKQIN